MRAIVRLSDERVNGIEELISWSSPVLAFGDPVRSRVATLGINPSNREFVDNFGCELTCQDRRLQTLASLGLDSWSDADVTHLNLIISSYLDYFGANPYNRWFQRLDGVVQGAHASFYDSEVPACHLDLVPYATSTKWALMPRRTQKRLIEMSADTLGLLIRDSAIECLILNGMSVITWFAHISNTRLKELDQPGWTLRRQGSADVPGRSYEGMATSVGEIELNRPLNVLGFNHNLQSSFGVTNHAVAAIRVWIREAS